MKKSEILEIINTAIAGQGNQVSGDNLAKVLTPLAEQYTSEGQSEAPAPGGGSVIVSLSGHIVSLTSDKLRIDLATLTNILDSFESGLLVYLNIPYFYDEGDASQIQAGLYLVTGVRVFDEIAIINVGDSEDGSIPHVLQVVS